MLPTQPRAVFISYAHADNQSSDPQKRWLDRFVEFLQPLVSQEDFTLCSDQDIKIGQNWHEQIQAHLSGAHGNVWEWVQDWYVPEVDRVNRGGSWVFDANWCRSAFRGHVTPGHRAYDTGFRLLRKAP